MKRGTSCVIIVASFFLITLPLYAVDPALAAIREVEALLDRPSLSEQDKQVAQTKIKSLLRNSQQSIRTRAKSLQAQLEGGAANQQLERIKNIIGPSNFELARLGKSINLLSPEIHEGSRQTLAALKKTAEESQKLLDGLGVNTIDGAQQKIKALTAAPVVQSGDDAAPQASNTQALQKQIDDLIARNESLQQTINLKDAALAEKQKSIDQFSKENVDALHNVDLKTNEIMASMLRELIGGDNAGRLQEIVTAKLNNKAYSNDIYAAIVPAEFPTASEVRKSYDAYIQAQADNNSFQEKLTLCEQQKKEQEARYTSEGKSESESISRAERERDEARKERDIQRAILQKTFTQEAIKKFQEAVASLESSTIGMQSILKDTGIYKAYEDCGKESSNYQNKYERERERADALNQELEQARVQNNTLVAQVEQLGAKPEQGKQLSSLLSSDMIKSRIKLAMNYAAKSGVNCSWGGYKATDFGSKLVDPIVQGQPWDTSDSNAIKVYNEKALLITKELPQKTKGPADDDERNEDDRERDERQKNENPTYVTSLTQDDFYRVFP